MIGLGQRALEPQLWVAGGPIEGGTPRRVRPEDFGRVNFDDEGGHTVPTLHVSRVSGGYVLHVENLTDPLTVQVARNDGALAETVAPAGAQPHRGGVIDGAAQTATKAGA